ncbi:MAG: hypothetical protein QS2022_0570 [Candidatus Phytoplasma asteris]|uniref:Predicted GTPases n=1 Tax='Chrysanthemum coronarium' phytoplasma TaxID=1520703 RepID=A0ABQ0J1Z8_9MOLU|nr:hypothetical protein ['Chrysanthemum coronarium' phytoplasma]TKA88248.1 MAG: hypothetical protein PLY_0570 [Periwinkle leaf yellowing phytoplasma]WEX19347.1 MAG: hypothetical protein QS2022_0570 [Candidatus Phytoplasma asteris]GAK73637.1 predicted GTPases ['Chrysanthemum coronarium' phytoplasma]
MWQKDKDLKPSIDELQNLLQKETNVAHHNTKLNDLEIKDVSPDCCLQIDEKDFCNPQVSINKIKKNLLEQIEKALHEKFQNLENNIEITAMKIENRFDQIKKVYYLRNFIIKSSYLKSNLTPQSDPPQLLDDSASENSQGETSSVSSVSLPGTQPSTLNPSAQEQSSTPSPNPEAQPNQANTNTSQENEKNRLNCQLMLVKCLMKIKMPPPLMSLYNFLC